MAFNNKPVCKECYKEPHEIGEYVFEARMEGIAPSEWVKQNERPTTDGNFYCTDCYIKAGMPLW